jgi:hypothetical protein
LQVFAELYGTNELLSSFDSINLMKPGIDASGGWLHVDHAPLKKGCQCIQGLINMVDVGPDTTGGLLCIYCTYDAWTSSFWLLSYAVALHVGAAMPLRLMHTHVAAAADANAADVAAAAAAAGRHSDSDAKSHLHFEIMYEVLTTMLPPLLLLLLAGTLIVMQRAICI